MAIKLDISAALVVVYCTDCTHWRAAAWTITEGHNSAVRHEDNVHEGQSQARKAAERHRSRHAEKTIIVS